MLQLSFDLLFNKAMLNLIAQTPSPVDIGKEWILKPGQSITGSPQFQTPGALISIILKNVYVLAGVFLLILLIFGGFSIIMGAGQGDAKKTGQGKKAATSAVVGFLVIFASYWIIQIIQIITGVEILNKK